MASSPSLNRRNLVYAAMTSTLALAASNSQGNAQMVIKQINVQRLSVTSSKSFDRVMATLEDVIGHPNMSDFVKEMGATRTYAELEKVVQSGLGRSGFMEFARYDLGLILRKERGEGTPKSLRLVIGNPLIMKEMLKHVPDAGSYAPVTVLIDERPDGVHLSYDRMASFLAPYGSPDALKVAQDLDAKVENLLTEAAS
jgi:uncharacterized protein (DUF302 family)